MGSYGVYGQVHIKAASSQARRITDSYDPVSLVNAGRGLKQRDFLLGEVNHRVQNSLTLVAGFLSMQARASGDSETKAALSEARHRVAAVAMVNRRLYVTEQAQLVNAASYVDELLEDLISSIDPGWKDFLQRDLAEVVLPTDKTISLGLITAELFINSTKYAYDGAPGPLYVGLSAQQGLLEMTFADRGRGRSQSVAAQPTGTGFGSRMMGVLVQGLGGNLRYENNDPGTKAYVTVRMEPDWHHLGQTVR